jgi:hypothetical protein
MSDEPTPLHVLVIPSQAGFHEWLPLDVLEAPARDGLAEFLNDLVGGFFQVVSGPAGSSFYLSDDGKFRNLAENAVATALAHEAAGLSVADWIAGPVVVCGRPDREGNDTSVPEEFLRLLEDRGCTVRRRPVP